MIQLMFDPIELKDAASYHSRKTNFKYDESVKYIQTKIKNDVDKRLAMASEDGLLYVYSYLPSHALVTFDF